MSGREGGSLVKTWSWELRLTLPYGARGVDFESLDRAVRAAEQDEVTAPFLWQWRDSVLMMRTHDPHQLMSLATWTLDNLRSPCHFELTYRGTMEHEKGGMVMGGGGESWVDPNGRPLKFQDGDYVKIDTSSRPERAYTLPFLEGYVRGYNLSGLDGVYGAAYELFRMGHNPLRWVKEECLARTPEMLPHSCPSGRECGICRGGAGSEGLSIFAGPTV